MGEYIDSFLQVLVIKIASYLKDTKQVLNELSDISVTDRMFLITADVSSLYTSISHREGMVAVEYYLKQASDIHLFQQRFILDLLNFATTHSFCWFYRQYYLQIRGVAMGSKFSPSLDNLLMSKWELDDIYNAR